MPDPIFTPDEALSDAPAASGLRIPAVTVRVEFVGFDAVDPVTLLSMYLARKRTFVDELGWSLPSGDRDYESDQFDRSGTVYALVSDAFDFRYSARILPRAESMVASLWPEALPLVAPAAIEFSRFCHHVPGNPRWTRASTAVFKAALVLAGYRDLFGIADARMVRVYSLLDIKPTSIQPVPGAEGLLLCQWRL